jgi:peptide/nickel transport system substrate-binding protein
VAFLVKEGDVRHRRKLTGIAALVLLLTACGPAAAPVGSSVPESAGQTAPQQALIMLVRIEPRTLADRVSVGSGRTAQDVVNAGLTYRDTQGLPQPYLVEELPRLGTDSWRVSPDGRMETVYRLRPGLVWHDGAPLTADDFVFTERVVTDPSSKVFAKVGKPTQLDEMVAADSQTLVFRWKGPDRQAGEQLYQPLPKHLLEADFERGDPDGFANRPYWTSEYVHLGAYRVVRWEPGAFIEAAAFAQHALGAPKIERLKILWAPDPNVAVANLMAGEVHFAVDQSVSFDGALLLKRAWETSKAGDILLTPASVRYLQVQVRPEYVRPTALLDPTVRKALVHSIDKNELADAILQGMGSPADMLEPPPGSDAYAAAQRAISRYPYDLRRAEQLLNGAGFQKGSDGFYAGPNGRLDPDIRARAGQEDQEATIVVDGWRRSGLDAGLTVVTAAQAANQEFRSTFPGLSVAQTTMGEDTALGKLVSWNVPAPTNRWTGTNRGAWSHPEYDRLVTEFNSSLERDKQLDLITQAMKLMSDEVAAIPLYYSYDVAAHTSGLMGPRDAVNFWNIHQWEWR